jgi:4'-phosphopantetheinyl transferase EntD
LNPGALPDGDPGALVDGVFPADIAVAWARVSDVPGALFPEEDALLAKAVEKRRREFAHGRGCARRALAAHGAAAAPLLIGTAREPLWPPGFVGSITHDREVCVAVAALSAAYAGVGIDVEPDEALTPSVAARIWSPAEAEAARSLAVVPEDSVAKLVFAAKEAVYKAQFPLTRTYVGFHGVSVELTPGAFTAVLTAAVPPLPSGFRFTGTWRRAHGEIFAAVWLAGR